MTTERLPNIHPGEILQEEFLEPMGISQNQLARDVRVPANRINAIVRGQRAITADTALRLAKYFGTSAAFWLGLQMDYDLEEQALALKQELERIAPAQATAPADQDVPATETRPGSVMHRITGLRAETTPAQQEGSSGWLRLVDRAEQEAANDYSYSLGATGT